MGYNKMVESNLENSKRKVEIAKREIQKMLNKKEKITVTELSKNTGFARSFFYRNSDIRATLEEAQLNQGECYNPKKLIFDSIAKEVNVQLKLHIKKLEKRIKELEIEKQNLEVQNQELLSIIENL